MSHGRQRQRATQLKCGNIYTDPHDSVEPLMQAFYFLIIPCSCRAPEYNKPTGSVLRERVIGAGEGTIPPSPVTYNPKTQGCTLVLDNFIADMDRYSVLDGRSRLLHLLSSQGLWALAEYRYSNWVHRKVKVPLVRQLCKLFGRVWHYAVMVVAGIDLPEAAKIGKGLYIGHFGGIVISGGATIGEFCNINHEATIGVGGARREQWMSGAGPASLRRPWSQDIRQNKDR